MQEERFLIIPNKKELKLYENYGFNTFILPLKGYSIGYNVYFDISEINELSKKFNIYVLMNKFLHKKIYDFKEEYPKFNSNVKFIVEDIGLVNIIDKDRLVLWENHILSNSRAINYLSSLEINNVVINNDLTISELESIMNECSSQIFYHYISKNILMYSRRNLVSNFNKFYNIDNNSNSYLLNEKVSHKILELNEISDGSIVRFNKIFCASKYISKLKKFNLIIDLSYINEEDEKKILENYNKESLCDLIDCDYYFLEHDIKYKVGDLK